MHLDGADRTESRSSRQPAEPRSGRDGEPAEWTWKETLTPALMDIDIDITDSGACVVRLGGEVDVSNVDLIRERLEQRCLIPGHSQVVLDLREVTYVDSSALGLIVWLDHKLAPADGRLVMAGASRDVERILELSGLVGVAPTIGTSDSVDEAVDSLDGEAPAGGALRWSESIVLPAEVSSLAKVRKAVCDMLGPVRLTESARFDVKVAVGEALANAVRHGSPGGGADQVRIDVTLYSDRVVIQVRDTGGGFDPSHVPTTDLYASGGRGVLFMRALMDEVSFRSDGEGGGTVVQLMKRLGDHGVDHDRDHDRDHGGGSPG